MTEKSNSTVKNDNDTLINNIPKIPTLCEKIQNKMKKYKITNFHFILENVKAGLAENKVIPEKSTSEEEIIKIQELSTDENEKNKDQKKSNNSENFIIIPLKESPKINNKYSSYIPQFNDFSLDKTNKQNLNFEYNNNIHSSKKYKKNKEISQKYENIDIECEGFENFNEYNSRKYNDLIILNEDKNDNLNNNNNFLGKKIKFEKNSQKPNNYIKTEEFIDINNNGKLNVQKYMISKLIEKYSYTNIFNLFIKQYAKNIPEFNKNYDKEIDNILNVLIKELGIEKIMRILLSFSNSNDNYINYYSNKKNIEKINEINNNEIKYAIENENKLCLEEENKNLEIIYLDEEEDSNEEFKKTNNDLICLNEIQNEDMEKKHIIMNENNFDNHINNNNEEALKNYLLNYLNPSENLNVKNEKK